MTNNNPFLPKANILIEALPYIQTFAGKTVVIKYGGNAMTDPALTHSILQDITLLKYVGVNPVVVHGGGPEISKLLGQLNIKSSFHNGLRITDKDTMEVVQMVLTGKINKDIVSQLNTMGAKAIGICGMDANLITVDKMSPKDGVDLGYVGQIKNINAKLLELLSKDEFIPVIAPVGVGEDGESYNINADTAASEIAVALKAEKLLFLTDIDGIRRAPNDPDSLINVITTDQINNLIKDGTITGGMIPKVMGCMESVERGVKRTHIIDGTIHHPIILEMFTDSGIGTMVTA